MEIQKANANIEWELKKLVKIMSRKIQNALISLSDKSKMKEY